MTESQPLALLADSLHHAVHGEAWHGPSLLEALDVVPTDLLHRTTGHAHAPANIMLHAIAWIEEVTRRLGGAAPAMPARGDWSDASSFTRAQLRDLATTATAACVTAMRAFDPERLHDLVGTADRDAPLGAGVSYGAMLQGIAQHTTYHAGQIVLLSRAT